MQQYIAFKAEEFWRAPVASVAVSLCDCILDHFKRVRVVPGCRVSFRQNGQINHDILSESCVE